MFRVALVNMPFSNLALPSIALTQLKSVLDSRFAGQVSTEIVYLNHDFGRFLGTDFYGYLATSMEALNTGLGDWLFRQSAFPQLPDNTAEYLERYFPPGTAHARLLKELIAHQLPKFDTLLERLITEYSLDQADIVGFTSMFMQNTASFAVAGKLKRRNPAVITVMGGANCEFPMGRIIAKQVDCVDYVFSGPALNSFPEFVQRCVQGERDRCSSIRGVFAKGIPLPESGPATIGEELGIDTPVELDYDPFMSRLEKYFPNREVKPVLCFETSRGCWWGERAHCTFCGLNGASMGYRSMKPERALHLMNSLFRYSGKVLRLMAVDNILPKSYLTDVLPHLHTPAGMEIFYEVKADLSEQEMAVLAQAGVTQIQPGVEALATTTLKLMKKGTTVFQNLKLLKLCALYGVQPHWNLLVGFPGEGEEVYRKYVEVIPSLLHLYPPSGAYPVRFDRFSPYHDEAEKYQLDLQPLAYYRLIYPFDDGDLKDFAYYFADENPEAKYFTAMAKWIGKLRARVVQWQARWNSPGQIPPRLYFRQGSDAIYDSRSGIAIEHRVGTAARALLEYLARPSRVEDLPRAFSSMSSSAISDEIGRLEEKHLLFREDDRVFSLVLDGDHDSRHEGQAAATALASEAAISAAH